MNRRRFLLGATALTPGVAGCSDFFSEPSMLDLVVINHSGSPYTVEMALFQSGDDLSRSEARVFSESIDVEVDAQTRRTQVAEVRPYIIQYSLYENEEGRLTDQDHFHYHPPDHGGDTQAFDIDPAGLLTRR